MIIIGVDPGTRYAGYAILKKEKRKIEILEAGCLDIHKEKTLAKKIHSLYEFITGKVKEYRVTHLSLETPFLYKNAATFLKLGYVRGILYLISEQNSLILFEFSPSEIKQRTTGNGRASKEQVAEVIIRLFKIKKPQKDDTTDALACAYCGLQN